MICGLSGKLYGFILSSSFYVFLSGLFHCFEGLCEFFLPLCRWFMSHPVEKHLFLLEKIVFTWVRIIVKCMLCLKLNIET